MSLSRSATTVIRAASRSTCAALNIPSSQRCDSLSAVGLSLRGLTLPPVRLRTVTSTGPSSAPVDASTARTACSSSPPIPPPRPTGPDRESDIYEEFARRPAGVHLLTRVAQDRRIKTATDENASLFAFSDNLPEQARFVVTIPAAPGRKKPRSAELALRHACVQVRKPKNGAAPD